MALKDLFRREAGGGGNKPREYSANDLIALKRYDEAAELLEKRLEKNPEHLQTRLKRADLLVKMKQSAEALEEYLTVTDGYASDGFFDKAEALLAKLTRLMPHEERLQVRVRRIARAKDLERRRRLVDNAVTSAGKSGSESFSVRHLWSDLAKCPLVEELSEERLKRFFGAAEFIKLDADEVLCEPGDQRPELFIVVQGDIAVQVLLANGKRTNLRVMKIGDVFGDQALLRRRAWPASHVAGGRTVLVKLDRSGLEELLVGDDDPQGLFSLLTLHGHDRNVAEAMAKLRPSETEPADATAEPQPGADQS